MRVALRFLLLISLATTACQTTRKDLGYWLERAEKAAAKGNEKVLREATGRVAEVWRNNPSAEVQGYRLSVRASPEEAHQPLYFDHFQSAEEMSLKGLKVRQTRPGIGTPLVGVKEITADEPDSKYFSEEGLCHSLTAILSFDAATDRVHNAPKKVLLELHDPSLVTSANGKPLAADFSAALCESLGNPRVLRRQGLLGLLVAGDPKLEGGFLLTQPYDPNKTPLIFVHGLMSSQLAWRNLANDLFADPEIRRRYQIWFYHYPTGNPVLVSAKRFRDRLNKLRHDMDPSGSDPAMQRTVVIAHSMGGLLTKTLITTTGDKLWNHTFRVTPEQLNLDADEKRLLDEGLHWQPRKEVERVVFVAVPHRGSKIATSFVGRFAQRIIRIPSTIIDLSNDLLTLDTDSISEEARDVLNDLRLNSISNLALDDPMLLLLDSLPTAPWVHRHSIIGNRGKAGPLELSSDGVVPYTSSHLDGVDSEVIVPGNHGAYKTPEAAEEIMRVLKLP